MRRAWGIVIVWILVLLFALNTGRAWAYNLLYFVTGVIAVALWWAWANLRGLSLRRARASSARRWAAISKNRWSW